MRRIKFLIVLLFTLNLASCFSQRALYSWNTGICYCEGYFDSIKNNREQITNTYKILWWNPYYESKVTVWKIEEVEKLSVEALDNECSKKLDQLTKSQFINSKFWNNIKQERIEETSEFWELARITILGYNNPDTLMSYLTDDEKCIYYRNALISGGQEMLDAWLKLHETQMKQSGNPQKLEEKFQKLYISSERYENARIELMSFGWWNSANSKIKHINMSMDFEKEFEKLFQDIKCECDEP